MLQNSTPILRRAGLAALAVLLGHQLTLAQAVVAPVTSFGAGGTVVTGAQAQPLNFSEFSPGTPMWSGMGQATVSGNHIYVVGSRPGTWLLQRYTLDGALDASFGTNGSVASPFAATLQPAANGVTVQPDGKVLVVGSIRGDVAGPTWAVSRFTAQGALDPTFGTNGLQHPNPPSSGTPFEMQEVVVLPNGNLLVAGAYARFDYSSRLMRLLPNGQPDNTFNNGSAILPMPYLIHDLVSLPDGKLLLVGKNNVNSSTPEHIRVTRLTATGDLDPSFGTGGVASISGTATYGNNAPVRAFSEAFGAAVQPDGKILLAGRVVYTPTMGALAGDRPLLLRMNADGTPDAAFNTNADRSIVRNGGLLTVALQSDGRIVVGGALIPSFTSLHTTLARYSSAGVLDASFSGATSAVPGVYTAPTTASRGMVRTLTVLPDNQLLTFGGFAAQGGNNDHLTLSRFTGASPNAIRASKQSTLALQAAPVPTDSPLHLRYTLLETNPVRLTLRDQLGRTVATLANGSQSLGAQQQVDFDAARLPDGLYQCQLMAGARQQTLCVVITH